MGGIERMLVKMSLFGGLLLGYLLFGHSHRECHCKKCEKKRKEDTKWWKAYYKKYPWGSSVSPSYSVSLSPSGSCSPSV